MRRVFGNRKKINLGSSEFRRFIEKDCLYIDKTRFIEHVLEEASDILLFTRPRRTGKSLNLDMLRTFLDCGQDAGELFKGLYIEGRPAYGQLGSAPVIYMNFKELSRIGYDMIFRENLRKNAVRYLSEDQIGGFLRQCLNGESQLLARGMYELIQDIHEAYGVKPYVLIDEYDKLLMDNLSAPEYDEIRQWLKGIFESSLKDNRHLEKGVMVGVTRVSQEGLLSGLNNLEVFDVFESSVFDGDFSLTEDEAEELLEDGQLNVAREWYNNYRVGDIKLFTMYSALSYAKKGVLENYWGMSGSMDMLMDALTADRADAITALLSEGKEIETAIERRTSLKQLRGGNLEDEAFYSFAVQTGYLTYELLSRDDAGAVYRLRIPNKELSSVWRNFILQDILKSRHRGLRDIFANISDTDDFASRFQDFVSFQLSSYDIGKELEKTYHVLVFGLILGAGYKCSSNRERGHGRYDLWLEGPDFNVIIEFKRASKETEDLEELAYKAIEQIDNMKYFAKIPKNAPLYKVGVGCYGAGCYVAATLHENS